FSVLEKGGVNSLMILCSSSTSSSSAFSMAVRERAASPSPESTLQDCAIESILHSSDACDPSGEPSSKLPRLYHCPSQAVVSSARLSTAACFSQAATRL